MADQDQYKTQGQYNPQAREVRTAEPSSNLPLIVGGLVVAVAFILWLVFGGQDAVVGTPAGDTTNVTVETPAAPAPAPAAEPAADPAVNTVVDPAPEAAAPEAAAPVAPSGGAVTPAPVEE